MWRGSWKDGACAEMQLEAVHQNHLLAAADLHVKSFAAFLFHQILPLVQGREGGAYGPSADIHVEGISKIG